MWAQAEEIRQQLAHVTSEAVLSRLEVCASLCVMCASLAGCVPVSFLCVIQCVGERASVHARCRNLVREVKAGEGAARQDGAAAMPPWTSAPTRRRGLSPHPSTPRLPSHTGMRMGGQEQLATAVGQGGARKGESEKLEEELARAVAAEDFQQASSLHRRLLGNQPASPCQRAGPCQARPDVHVRVRVRLGGIALFLPLPISPIIPSAPPSSRCTPLVRTLLRAYPLSALERSRMMSTLEQKLVEYGANVCLSPDPASEHVTASNQFYYLGNLQNHL